MILRDLADMKATESKGDRKIEYLTFVEKLKNHILENEEWNISKENYKFYPDGYIAETDIEKEFIHNTTNIASLIECKTYRQYKRYLGQNHNSLKLSHFDKLPPLDKKAFLFKNGDRCFSSNFLKGSISDCILISGENGEIGDCRNCPYYRPASPDWAKNKKIEMKQNIKVDCDFLKDIVESYRKGYSDKEDILQAFNWICKNCNGKYQSNIMSRIKEGCPYCNNRKALYGLNSIFDTEPTMMKEWLYPINMLLGLNPKNMLAQDSRKVWWKCSDCGQTYKQSPQKRVLIKKRKMKACPHCKGYHRNQHHFF